MNEQNKEQHRYSEQHLYKTRPSYYVGAVNTSCECSFCGAALDEDERFCSECGNPRHASFHRSGSGWIIRDEGSRNGTAVNGKWCYSPLSFQIGDTIRLGDSYDFIVE